MGVNTSDTGEIASQASSYLERKRWAWVRHYVRSVLPGWTQHCIVALTGRFAPCLQSKPLTMQKKRVFKSIDLYVYKYLQDRSSTTLHLRTDVTTFFGAVGLVWASCII